MGSLFETMRVVLGKKGATPFIHLMKGKLMRAAYSNAMQCMLFEKNPIDFFKTQRGCTGVELETLVESSFRVLGVFARPASTGPRSSQQSCGNSTER